LEFIYKEEYWYVSAFVKSGTIEGEQNAKEIEEAVKTKFNSLSDKDIYKKDLKDKIFEIVRNTSIECKWVTYLENFPYQDENSEREFNTLGYFRFKVEHFKQNPERKQELSPMLLQQIPFLVLSILQDFAKDERKRGIYVDLESPIYVFVTSNGTKPIEIQWTPENIETYKKVIAYWTVIYSGQWEDYSESLYSRRVEDNLSNRLTELHFIGRNSAFVYMAPNNYTNFFKSYMIDFVLEPTPKMRAVQFALRSINESLDLLFLKSQTDVFQNVSSIEGKIKNLRLLRGLIQTKLSAIYNELDYNRREHYTKVLEHLLREFDIDNFVKRISEKFNTIYDAIQQIYHKKNEENQKRTERGLSLLNLLFGAGVLADLAGLIMITFALQEGNLLSTLLNGIISFVIVAILATTVLYYLYIKLMMSKTEIQKAVDAIIEDGEGNVILIKRRYPPFKDYYALPGGGVEKGEKPKQALIRETKEETNLNVQIKEKVGVYDQPGRDPRGNVHSTAYKCRIIGDKAQMKSGDDSNDVILVPKEELIKIKLAFDHKQMLRDAGLIK
jgi:8-oxo-dGTP diphosphatase